MPNFTFTSEDEGVQTSSSFEAETWMDALEKFEYFLKGIGYVFEGSLGLVEEVSFSELDFTHSQSYFDTDRNK